MKPYRELSKDELIREIESLKNRITELCEKDSSSSVSGKSDLLESLFHSTRDYIYMKDLSGNYTWVNPSIEKLFKIPASDILGKNAIFLFGEKAGRKIMENDKRVLNGEEVESFPIYDVGGESRIYHTIKTPLKNSDGIITGICGISRDITNSSIVDERLRASEKKYRDLYQTMRVMMDTVPDLIWVKDVEGRFTFTNKAICQVLLNAKDTDEPIGNTIDFFIEREKESHKDDPHWFTFGDENTNSDAITMKKGKVCKFDEYGNVRGEFLYLDVYKTPLRDENGDIIGTVGCARIVTEEKQREAERKIIETNLKESEEKFRRLIETVPFGIAIHFGNRISYVNDALMDILKIENGSDVLDKHISHWATDEFADILVAQTKAATISSDHPVSSEIRMKRQDGKIIDVMAHSIPVPLSGKPANYTIISDITELKETQRKLFEYQSNLEKLVKQRTAELEKKTKNLEESQLALSYLLEDVNESTEQLLKVNKKLEAANRELESFSYSVSHDLRTPLRAILGFSEKLHELYGDQLDPEGARLVDVLCKNALKMKDLIDDILELSRTGRAKLHPQKIDMEEIIHSVYFDLSIQIGDRDIKFSVDKLPKAFGDHNLIKQVVTNLLSNSIKFTQKEKKAEIHVGYTGNNDETIYFVKDNGVGFNPKYTEKLFDVFHRLHRESDFEGTGVGLAIVHRIITMHGGRVWADAVPGKGATFYFTF